MVPRLGGHETLGRIKDDPTLRIIPVIMLSTSVRPDDIRRPYEAHANRYVEKPRTLDHAERIIRALEAFWLDVAILPSCDERRHDSAVQTP